jgi:hypothetical protein
MGFDSCKHLVKFGNFKLNLNKNGCNNVDANIIELLSLKLVNTYDIDLPKDNNTIIIKPHIAPKVNTSPSSYSYVNQDELNINFIPTTGSLILNCIYFYHILFIILFIFSLINCWFIEVLV